MNKIKTIITEEHSSQLHVWHQLGLQNATLIYFDAHLDLQHISQSRIDRLLQCQTTKEIKDLEKPYHMVPDDGYSYSIEDFLYAAHHLKMIDRVVWVHPFNREHQNNPMHTIRMLQSQQGFSLDDFTSFEIVDNYIEATLLGLKVTICSYQDLVKLDLPDNNTLIDVDIDYFIVLPEDKPWIDPQIIFEALKALAIDYDTVTLTRSVTSGYMPLRYRFIADYMSALWRDDRREARHFARLFTLDNLAYTEQAKTVIDLCLAELSNFPDCAATYYLMSICETDPLLSQQYGKTAAKLSKSYSPSVLRSTNAIMSRELEFNTQTLESLEQRLQNEFIDSKESELTHFSLGLLYSSIGNLEGALRHYRVINISTCPQLNLAIADLMMRDNKEEDAIPLLKEALKDESTEAEAHKLLGTVYLRQKRYTLSLDNFLIAKNLLPSSPKILKSLIQIYKQLGDEANYEINLARYRQIKFFLQ